ncbi:MULTISPECIES: hypothetical protein [Streptomyces]|uniref:hypothetical protein n=1 Tax=Streptomyces TaxID=1883 RepID=UPI001676B879|nr:MULTISPECIES: hypothetical protein [Streptomyces]MBD3576936.1 hypothetical protein [Streptomyces sp. KD18]GGT05022.1 hypothetical protein GCM10010286_32830 [Streptomyces toxytricini]
MSRRPLAGVAARADLPSGLLDRLVAIAVRPNATLPALWACLEDARARKDAAAHPALPAAVVAGLLGHPHPEVAWAAAGHPALPAAAVERLVAEAERAGPAGRAPG